MIKPELASRRRALAAMCPDQPVRVYTYQHPGAWAAALARGYLTGEGIPDREIWTEYDEPYAWMRGQMSERLPAHSGDLPVWCWLKRRNPRNAAWIGGKVRITALVPRGRMLISDHTLWEGILNGCPIMLDEREWDDWQAAPEDRRVPASATWDEVFTITDRTGVDLQWIRNAEALQACVDRIMLAEVVDVRPMPLRGRIPKEG